MPALYREFVLGLLKEQFPQIAQGERDARDGRWQNIAGDAESIAYEIGRMLFTDPPTRDGVRLPGLICLPDMLALALRDLEGCLAQKERK